LNRCIRTARSLALRASLAVTVRCGAQPTSPSSHMEPEEG
jgi:hypothetical protein